MEKRGRERKRETRTVGRSEVEREGRVDGMGRDVVEE